MADRAQPGPGGTGSHPIHDQPGVSTTQPDYRPEPESPRLSVAIPTQSQILSTTFTPITRGQISRIKVPVSFDPKVTIQNESFKKIVESTPSITDIIPKVYTDDALVFSKSAIVQPAIESQYRRNFEEELDGIAEAVQERDERAERQVEMAAAQLDVLQTMAANMQQLNQKMESVDRRIYESNKSADKASRWAFFVGVSTLLVTITGVIVTIIMG